MRVTPFGYPGIIGCLLLPPAFRSLPRPSSPSGSQASAIDLFSLDHIIFPFRARLLPRSAKHAPVAPGLRGPRAESILPSSGFGRQRPHPSVSSFPRRFKDLLTKKLFSFSVSLEIRGFEPLTLGLQSRCSSQLSYIPGSIYR